MNPRPSRRTVDLYRRIVAFAILTALLASAILLWNQVARATPSTDIAPPAEVTAVNPHPVRYTNGFGNPQVQYDVWLNFTRSPSDPGTWNYTYTLKPNLQPAIIIHNQAPTPVPDRATQRWVSFRISGSSDINTDGPAYSFNVTAHDPAGDEGLYSCSVAITLTTIGAQSQCGNLTLAAPAIQNVSVSQALTVSTGNTWIVFRHSTDDPNASTTGDYRYIIDEQFIQYDSTPSVTTYVPGQSPAGSGHNGERWFNITYAGTSPFALSLDTQPVDDRTGLHGTPTCLTTVDTGHTFSTSRCGLYFTYAPTLQGPPTTTVSTTPRFPLLNITDEANAFGTTPTVLALGLGAALILGTVLLLTLVAGAGAGAIGGVTSFSLALVLGLIPPWIAILAFFLISLLLAARITGGANP
ncbi:MAG: hypothetical protein ACYDDF_11510 [Thermoplasmatota archaeon]